MEYAMKVRVYTVPAVADRAAARAAHMFGGYTLVDGVGGWVDGDNVLVEEGVKVLEIVTTAHADKIESFLVQVDRMARDAGEDCVLATQEPVRMAIRDAS